MNYQNIITVLCPGQESHSYDLDRFNRSEILLGRTPYHGDSPQLQNDISIESGIISRAHCRLNRDENGNWHITDENSTNGLMFNDRKVSAHRLIDGDKIYIGNKEGNHVVLIYSRRQLSTGVQEDSKKDFQGVKKYSLNKKKQFVIGRAQNCDIVIAHPTASRRHCVITFENGKYYIADNNSTNGVIVNSRLLKNKQVLKESDRITIGGTSFVFMDGFLYSYEITGGVSVSAVNLYRAVGKGKQRKTILKDINLFIEPNQFYAIIGGSGAGKTTLLNCLSGMTGYSKGEVLINGESIRVCGKSLRSLMGYVPQQDIVYDSLTLEKMLYYSAKIRMPEDTTDKDIEKKITETLDMVELSAHRKTLISRLSGGEKKRASIAVELLASPKLFFLDEPSSGLDPGTEKHLMQLLKKLADSGKTVIMITHTVQNLDLCDGVIFLGRGGRLCFAGSPDDALKFFKKTSTTDVYDVLNDKQMAKAAADYYKQRFVSKQLAVPKANTAEKKTDSGGKGFRGMVKDFVTMTRRYVAILLSNRTRMLLLLLMPVLLSFLVCVAFEADANFGNFILRHGGDFIRHMFPFKIASHTYSLILSFSCAAFWIGIFNSIQEISKERPIYERERFSGVGVVPYVFSKFIPLTLLCLIQTFCMVVILRFMTNTSVTPDGNLTNEQYAQSIVKLGMYESFGKTFTTTFLCVLSAMCLGMMISSIASNDMALVLCPVCLMPQILFANVVSELSGFTLTLSNIITAKWSCKAFMISAKEAGTYDEAYTLYNSFTGNGASQPYEFTSVYEDTQRFVGEISDCWLAMAAICIVCVAGAVTILYFRKNQTR